MIVNIKKVTRVWSGLRPPDCPRHRSLTPGRRQVTGPAGRRQTGGVCCPVTGIGRGERYTVAWQEVELHLEISSSQEATQLHSTNPSTRWGHTGHTGSDTAISASLDMYQAEACGDTLRRWGRGSGWTSRPGPPWWWPTPGRRRVAGGLRQSGSFLSCENIYIESLEHLHV